MNKRRMSGWITIYSWYYKQCMLPSLVVYFFFGCGFEALSVTKIGYLEPLHKIPSQDHPSYEIQQGPANAL